MPTHRIPLAPCLLAAAAATAAEPLLSDLRVGLEARPTAYDYTWADHGRGYGGRDAFDQAWALAAGWRGGIGRAGATHHLTLGGDLLALRESAAGGARDGLLLRPALGWAWGLDDDWTAGAEAMAAAGPARWRLDAGTGTQVLLRGWMVEGGAQAWLRWRPGERWSATVAAGWLAGRDRLAEGDAALASTRGGPLFALALGWTLDPLARELPP